MNLSDDNLNLNKIVSLNIDPNIKPNILLALLAYIDKIVTSYPPPYTLMCSGGADSQVMLWAWELSGHEYTAVHITYDDYNKFDTDTLDEFTKKYQILYKKINFDVVNFLENDLDTYARKYQCASPHICTYIAMSELIPDGTKIFSGNLVYVSGNLSINNTIFGLQRYATISKNSIIPFFLLQDDNVISAAAKLYNNLDKSSIPKFGNSNGTDIGYLVKTLMYTTAGIPIISQNKNFTGFDRIKEYYDQFQNRVSFKEKMQYSMYGSRRIFDHLFRHKYYIEFRNDYSATVRLVINN
jgi:hypothetical protein